ncbi:hypothetical protein PGT21_032719 [Puccinia graminis f. sp. tritici]|uniref:Uncharacterized protein n=1 Tax=Puccinia graminis f. sp. tritici TaxID=56615 RepID=A0A5B0PJU5_PUCGR|nr:hypothetical protein PGT21_032719 [Puccinia graminis f. sp. tritici]
MLDVEQPLSAFEPQDTEDEHYLRTRNFRLNPRKDIYQGAQPILRFISKSQVIQLQCQRRCATTAFA